LSYLASFYDVDFEDKMFVTSRVYHTAFENQCSCEGIDLTAFVTCGTRAQFCRISQVEQINHPIIYMTYLYRTMTMMMNIISNSSSNTRTAMMPANAPVSTKF